MANYETPWKCPWLGGYEMTVERPHAIARFLLFCLLEYLLVDIFVFIVWGWQ